MKKLLALAAAIALFSGCSTMRPARYSMSVDNNQALKKIEGAKARVADMGAAGDFNANCRMMGPIQAADGMTVPQFVHKALNDEFKFAGVYSDTGVALNGTLDRVAFSSTSGITSGYWDLAMTLKSSNGKSLSVQNRYDFKSGFDAITACNQTAQALGPAVQDLIKKAVTSPEFVTLVR